MAIPFTDNLTVLNAVVVTTPSTAYDVSKRSQMTVQFIASSITSGNGVFSIDASNDGVNWVTGIAFRDAKATTSTTWVNSKTLSSNTTEMAFVPCGYKLVRVVCTRSTDGIYTAIIQNG